MLAPRKPLATLTSTTITDLNNVMLAITRRLIRSASFLALSRQRISGSAPQYVTFEDTRTAIDLLGLPRRVAGVFTTLPSRLQFMGLKITASKYCRSKYPAGRKGDFISVEVAETVLKKHALTRAELVHSRVQWPAMWNSKDGFLWDSSASEGQLENKNSEEDTMAMKDTSPSDQIITDGTSGVAQVSEGSTRFRWTSETPTPSISQNENINLEDLEDDIIEAETRYLESMDDSFAKMEQRRLNQYIKRGEAMSNKRYRENLKSLANHETGNSSGTELERAQKQFKANYKDIKWDDYDMVDDDDAKNEASGLLNPSWTLFQKTTPSALTSRRQYRKRKSQSIGTKSNKRSHLESDKDSEDALDEYGDSAAESKMAIDG